MLALVESYTDTANFASWLRRVHQTIRFSKINSRVAIEHARGHPHIPVGAAQNSRLARSAPRFQLTANENFLPARCAAKRTLQRRRHAQVRTARSPAGNIYGDIESAD